MSTNQPVTLNEENRNKIFGTFDGEGENIDRLKEYYFKNDIYESLISDQPLKILVGNKGVGKSALFRVAYAEARENNVMAVNLEPDDVAEIWEKQEEIDIIKVRKWKHALTENIANKVLQELELFDPNIGSTIIPLGHKIFTILSQSLTAIKKLTSTSTEQISKIDNFLRAKKIVVFLDDIDRNWQNRKESIKIIVTLIAAMRSLSFDNPGLSFKLALRLDVYRAVRTNDESADKWEGAKINLSYKVHDIFVFLIKRILTFYGHKIDDKRILETPQGILAKNLAPIFEEVFRGKGKWKNVDMKTVLTSLIRNRPRDLVKLCIAAAKEAYQNGDNTIRTEHILTILPNYSESIIDDTIGEYGSELPQLDKLLYGMKPTKRGKSAEDSFKYTTKQLHDKLFQIMQNTNFKFASGGPMTAKALKDFLYKINFITARKYAEDGRIERFNYEENQKLSLAFLEDSFEWEVHLAYRWVLQPDSIDDIFEKISIQ
ncbi:P-loop ATPase, Sll1717 family [Pedobacter sp. 22163]|uniref:P-loop ATPase, Sll1717 family n=1 Tax=Pedobacter sp. 22163 TaxID=3453883 RepID=UPI003F85B728